jgi:predicted nucleic acid-binding protein
MKKLLFLFFFSISLGTFAQNSEAQIYHDKLITEATLVGTALNTFNASLETDSAYLMHSSRAGLKRQLDSSIAILNTIAAYKNDDDWHRALIMEFQFYRDCVDKEYIKFIDYSLRLSMLNEDEITDFTKMISKLSEKEYNLSQIVDEAYEEFVKKYKVTPVK